MKSGVDDVRNALSANFGIVARSLFSIAHAHLMPWSKEEDYLNNFYSLINSSGLPNGVPISTPQSNYDLRVEAQKIHKTLWVDYSRNRTCKSCEIGDILLVAKYRDPKGVLSRCACLIQVKVSEKNRVFDAWKIDKTQLYLYSKWPTIQSCYVRYGRAHRLLLRYPLKIRNKNGLFSSYLFVGRTWQPHLLCGPSAWITNTALVAAALQTQKKFQNPLEIPLFTHLLQMLFQTSGERDIVNYKSTNANITTLVNSLLNYVNLNDPPKGEGKPFLVILLTLKTRELG